MTTQPPTPGPTPTPHPIPNFDDEPAVDAPFETPEGYIISAPMTLTRTGRLSYVAHSAAGGELRIGSGKNPGEFTPGELLKIALAGCNAMSADTRLAHVLGPDFPSEIRVETLKNEPEERYEAFQVTLAAPLASLSDDAATLSEKTSRAVRRYCTIGRTLEFGPTYEFRLADSSANPEAGRPLT